MGLGRTLRRAGRAVAKPFESAGHEVERTAERIGREAERVGGKLVSDRYKKDLRRARDISVAGFKRQLNPIPTVENSAASVLGPAGYTYLGYQDVMEDEEQRDYEQAQKREAAQRVKAEAERGQELLRRRRQRRLGSTYASGFGSVSTDFKTVLGI